jgi:hypothetical protein
VGSARETSSGRADLPHTRQRRNWNLPAIFGKPPVNRQVNRITSISGPRTSCSFSIVSRNRNGFLRLNSTTWNQRSAGATGKTFSERGWIPHIQFLRKLRFGLISSLAEVRHLRTWTATSGHARAAGTTVISTLIPRMARLVTNWIATSGVLGNLHACRVLGKFV